MASRQLQAVVRKRSLFFASVVDFPHKCLAPHNDLVFMPFHLIAWNISSWIMMNLAIMVFVIVILVIVILVTIALVIMPLILKSSS